MSRFTVGQEVTINKTTGFLDSGKFYKITKITKWGVYVKLNDEFHLGINNASILTREEYEQAEREKDPFAPGKWVVCVEDDTPLKSGDIISVKGAHFSGNGSWFTVEVNGRILGMSKCQFRPATPEEIKEQEKKIMDEKNSDEARANRQTFTVGGQEFYVGQSVWVDYGVLGHADGKPLEVVGYIYNTDGLILVRPSDAFFIIQLRVDGLMTEPPKPHEWKFRDWARHPEHGVVMAVLVSSAPSKSVTVANDDGYYNVDKDSLTYISTAEIPE